MKYQTYLALVGGIKAITINKHEIPKGWEKREVSHHTQDKIKQDIKENFYRDHAFNVTTPSYNEADTVPKYHSSILNGLAQQ